MKSMKLNTSLMLIVLMFSSINSLLSQEEPPDIFESIQPASAEAGSSNLIITLRLKDLGTPPIPPSEVVPTTFKIGDVSGLEISRNILEITASFSFSEATSNGMKEITIQFPGPNQQTITFSKAGMFEITGGEDPVITGNSEGGETLFQPIGSSTVYLIDEEGNIVNSWEGSGRPALSVYLLEDKSILKTVSLGKNGNQVFGDVGGAGGRVERYDWDNNLIWEFEYNSDEYLLHHDIEYLPNGNILMIAWQRLSETEAIAAGRNPELITDDELWCDKIIEVKPNGTSGGEIVWEWSVWDHLVQDFDNTKENYGIVADNPHKVNLNFYLNQPGADWNHTNAIDYNPELDQIVLCVRNFSEFWIINHNTTIEEAKGEAGDLLYRWGNPQTYGRGTAEDQKLFVPHDARWIDGYCPGAGNILVFNNGQGRPDGNYSSVDEITPDEGDGGYISNPGEAYGPTDLTWSYTSEHKTDFYSSNISGAHRLPGGNTIVCEGASGRFFEVTSEAEKVWEYINPYTTTNPQGEVQRSVFRATRVDLRKFASDDIPEIDIPYPIVDTDQEKCWDDSQLINPPTLGTVFYGQDAQHDGYQMNYTLSQDGLTVKDDITGLTWTQTPDLNRDGEINVDDKLSFADFETYPEVLNAERFGGYDDWRIPTMKELYSLMNFSGRDINPQSTDDEGLIPFIDNEYFDFGYGDIESGERIIDAQFWSSNEYIGKVFNNQNAAFGLNLADGRIKGYPTSGGQKTKLNYVYFVRGNPDYGKNDFEDNGDGTITDHATNLMWSKSDFGGNEEDPSSGLSWPDALSQVQQKNSDMFLGFSDWRLPNAKELQSIIDYDRAPDVTSSAAIDPVFEISTIQNEEDETDYPWYWTSTTHASGVDNGSNAVYICFGRALGYMNEEWMDVHGAGCQRSDPKVGSPDDYPTGHGPQGDAVRIRNYVRLVRDITETVDIDDEFNNSSMFEIYPNPANDYIEIKNLFLPSPLAERDYVIEIFDVLGHIDTPLENLTPALSQGEGVIRLDVSHLQPGIYFIRVGDEMLKFVKM